MSASAILADLAELGGTLRVTKGQLLLRAGENPIPGALIQRIRDFKADLIAVLQERQLVEWLDQHLSPSPSGRCAYCDQIETPDAVVVPIGTIPGTHTWLHPECWQSWYASRRREAAAHV